MGKRLAQVASNPGAKWNILKYYFHLLSYTDKITDATGVDAATPEEAYSLALEAVEEIQEDRPEAATDWIGWRLEITDETGNIVGVIHLSGGLS
jgi:hypothetical protein